MSTDSKCFEIKLDADARLAAAVAGGARHLGEAGGLSGEAAGKLQSAVLTVFDEMCAHAEMPMPPITVELRQFADRLEVMVVHKGDAPAVGLTTLLSKKGSPLEGVDRVQYDQSSGASRTTLTKFFGLHA